MSQVEEDLMMLKNTIQLNVETAVSMFRSRHNITPCDIHVRMVETTHTGSRLTEFAVSNVEIKFSL